MTTSIVPTKRVSTRTLQVVAGATALAAVAVYGLHWYRIGRYHEKTNDAYVGGDLTIIGPKVPGYINELPVRDNQFVHAGEVLVRIDERDYRAALSRADGTVNAQRAAVANFEATETLQQAVVARAEAGIEAADAEVQRSQQDYVRYKDLVGQSAVSVESTEHAEAAYRIARANAERARTELLAARRQVDVIATQKQQASAALDQARAEREIAALNLAYTVLRAPIDGYVGNRMARVGAYAPAGAQLLSLVPANGLWVDANFKEDQLARMRAGQPATIHADVLPGKALHGRIDSLAPATGAQFSILPPENATGNFTKIVQRVPVRIRLDAEDGQLGTLRPGLSVVAEIDTRTASSRGDTSIAEARR